MEEKIIEALDKARIFLGLDSITEVIILYISLWIFVLFLKFMFSWHESNMGLIDMYRNHNRERAEDFLKATEKENKN